MQVLMNQQERSFKMSDNVLQLNNANFDSEIGQGVTLVDFWAPWCGPCRMQGPIVDHVAAQVGPRAKVGKLNVDEVPSIAGEYGIQSIPTLVVFKDGQIVNQFVGVHGARELVGAINEALN
jgi:thioredoxin 1